MANFNTHLIAASTVSGITATGLLRTGLISSEEVILYFSIGSLSGLLPDLDSDNSIVLRILFTALALGVSFIIMFSASTLLSIAELLLLWLIIFLLVKFGVEGLFKKYTVHRGLFHSVPAGLIAALLTVICFSKVMGYGDVLCWMAGAFALLGYLTHLILDEMYSVDLSNQKIKRSFGSALKLFDTNQWPATIGLYAICLACAVFAPNPDAFFELFLNENWLLTLEQHLLPAGQWFERFLGAG